MNKLNKLILALLAALGIGGGAFAVNGGILGGSDVSQCYNASAGAATTSYSYLAPTVATTTGYIQCAVNKADSIDLNLFYAATTSNESLNLEVQWSHNNIDWFTETIATADSNNKTINYDTGLRILTRSGIGTSTANITINPVAARNMRVNVKSTGTNGGQFWMQVAKREGNNY